MVQLLETSIKGGKIIPVIIVGFVYFLWLLLTCKYRRLYKLNQFIDLYKEFNIDF